MQLSSQGRFRLLTALDEATGNSPAATGTKNVLEQQHATLRVEYDSACGCRKPLLCNSRSVAPQAARRAPPDSSQQRFEHCSQSSTVRRAPKTGAPSRRDEHSE